MTAARQSYAYPPAALRREEAARYVGLSVASFDRRDDLPAPVQIGPKTPVWRRRDLDAWLDRLAGDAPASAEGYVDAW